MKGPAAATLYGADASAGVIQILTKRGRTGVRRFTPDVTTEYDNIDPNFTPDDNYGMCTAAASSRHAPTRSASARRSAPSSPTTRVARNGVFNNGWTGILQYSAQGGGDNFGYYVVRESNNEQGTTKATS